MEGDFADMDDTTRGKGLQTVAGGVGAVFGPGGMKFGKTRTHTFTARPGSDEEGATRAATLANARLLDQLVALR